MIHYFIGDLGHLFVILSFVTSIAGAFSYWKATLSQNPEQQKFWQLNGRVIYYVHAASVIGICVTLFTIIANHYFEYHYAYSYSDSKLPNHYLISTFWNGQEGSFLLWMFWNALLGIVVLNTNKFWEGPVMTVFALVQAFLASMILGVVIPWIEFKIGSSPFILLRDAMQEAPIFKTNPNFIPTDGNGLNPLLQNYWMVIHPPTLFLGFSATLVPFCFVIAGLVLKRYREWVRPALPWALFAAAILGLGILMGGYWAYETLNFGGYWNWDPVENAVYVPWLILIGAIHTMIIYRNNGTSLKASMLLIIATFILILYSTFLTRSGILGDGSVHSFTDLGLSGQLLIYMLFFVAISIVLMVQHFGKVPASEKEASVYSREFWIFIGTLVIVLMGFQVLNTTSFPVYNKLFGAFGLNLNLATPTDQVLHYTRWQLWFSVLLALLTGASQLLWWKKTDAGNFWSEMKIPALITLLVFVICLSATVNVFGGEILKNPGYILILLFSLFAIITNVLVLFRLLRNSPMLSGGAIAHIGIGMMLIGILYSAGYSKIVSLNNTGLLYSREASEEYNRDNLLLFINEPRTMAGYRIEYKGERLEPREFSAYIDPSQVSFTADPYHVVAKEDIVWDGQKMASAKDTFEIFPENRYYEVHLVNQGGKIHRLFPRIQDNPKMGMAASPDIKRDLQKDLYAHVIDLNDPEKAEWSAVEEIKVAAKGKFFANDYVSTIDGVERVFDIEGVQLDSGDVAVKAKIDIQGEYKTYRAEPIFVIRNRIVGRIPDEIRDLGVEITLLNIHPETGEFSIGVRKRQKDWIIIKAMEKPLINVLWIGTLVVMTGFAISIIRRFREFSKMREKGQEVDQPALSATKK